MQFFGSNFEKVIIRFYLMMGIVLVAGFTGMWWLALLAFPVLLTAMMSIRFFDKKKATGKRIEMTPKQKEMKEAM